VGVSKYGCAALLGLSQCFTPATCAAAAEPTQAEANPEATARADIQTLMARFAEAIKAKDKAGFTALFLPGAPTWRSVMSDDTLVRARKRRSDIAKAPEDPGYTPQKMMDNIIASSAISSEHFEHVQILTDGDLATVWFDYRFCIGERVTNYGHESWQLLRADDGWRIASVVWSIRLPDADGNGTICR